MLQDIDLGHCVFSSKKSGNEMLYIIGSKIIYNSDAFHGFQWHYNVIIARWI